MFAMSGITISKQAKEDLIAIWSYIADDSQTAADHVLDTLNDQLTLLSAHPHLGRERPDIAPGLRYCISNNYLVLYRVHEEQAEIVRVLHGARNISVLFEDEADAA